MVSAFPSGATELTNGPGVSEAYVSVTSTSVLSREGFGLRQVDGTARRVQLVSSPDSGGAAILPDSPCRAVQKRRGIDNQLSALLRFDWKRGQTYCLRTIPPFLSAKRGVPLQRAEFQSCAAPPVRFGPSALEVNDSGRVARPAINAQVPPIRCPCPRPRSRACLHLAWAPRRAGGRFAASQ